MILEAKSHKLKVYPTMRRATPGFTLIEILTVVAIIALLVAVVLANLGGAKDKAIDAQIIADMVRVQGLAEIYFAENNQSYGPTFGININCTVPPAIITCGTGGWPTSCPEEEGGINSMFNTNGPSVAEPIYDTIQHVRSVGSEQSLCISIGVGNNNRGNSYAVASSLKEVGPSPTVNTYYCIDSKGTVKKLYTDPNGSVSQKNPFETVFDGESLQVQCKN